MTLGRAAAAIAEGLRGQPACLAAILLAAIFAVLTYFAMQRDADRRTQLMLALMEKCSLTGEAK